jgi:hypothetical protein
MRFSVLCVFLTAIGLSSGSCNKTKNEQPNNAGAELKKMCLGKTWEIVSEGYITDIDDEENRYIAYIYSDTTRPVFSMGFIDDSTVSFRGNPVRVDSFTDDKTIVYLSNKSLPRTTAYLVDLKLTYYADRDSIAGKQDSTLFYDPNTLFIHTL